MKQHPIPQNILDVEFKLFTKFTVREFIYMATGIGFGGIFLYFATRGELTYFIAIPIFLISSGIGLFLGLVPLNGQNADTYLTNYITAITRPTRRVWTNDQFDQKVEGIAEERGLKMTQGKMEQIESKVSGNAKIIGGVDSQKLGTNQFVQAAQVTQELDNEEAQKLAVIEQLVEQELALQTGQTAVQSSTATTAQPAADITPDQYLQPDTAHSQPTGETTPTIEPSNAAAVATIPEPTEPQSPVPAPDEIPVTLPVQNVTQAATPVRNRPRVTITKENISQFDLTIEGLVATPNTIYLHIEDGAQPIHRAMVMIRDMSENVLSVYHTNQEGNLINAKPLQPGEYLVDIEFGQYNFPRLHYVIESGIYPPILVTPIN